MIGEQYRALVNGLWFFVDKHAWGSPSLSVLTLQVHMARTHDLPYAVACAMVRRAFEFKLLVEYEGEGVFPHPMLTAPP